MKTADQRASFAQQTARHLLQLEGMSGAELTVLLDGAQRIVDAGDHLAERVQGRVSTTLTGRTIANLFLEDSTRTRSSFTLAARRLGAQTIDLTSAGSSVSKGETIVDTALNLRAMGVAGFVVRCSAAGGPHMIAKALDVPVINAGDGRHEHPTQGLLDMLTIRQRLKGIKGKTIGIVGDISASRVARSNVHGLTTLGANVILCGPATLAPASFQNIAAGPGTVTVTHDLDEILPSLDAIMMLRVQFERTAPSAPSPITSDYHELYGLTVQRAARMPEHAIVMHPGPMNRGLEIDSEVADDSRRSVILQQVTNGVAVRMAVLQQLVK